MTPPTRPVMRYHGGKWRLAPWILGFFPPHRIYVEPFGGAASLLMRKAPSFAEVYNDLDGDVVNVFRVLRDPAAAAELKRQLELTPWARVEFFAAYEPCEEPVERARRTIIRAFMSHGSTSRRKNRTGFRAKAFRQNQTSGQDWVKYPQQIAAYVERLQGVVIESRPALDIIRHQDDETALFYVDPPYTLGSRSSVNTRSDRDRAYAHDLEDEDHAELARALHGLRGMVVVSGYASPLYDVELYPDWERHECRATADGGQERTEVVWLNPACSSALRAARAQQEIAL